MQLEEIQWFYFVQIGAEPKLLSANNKVLNISGWTLRSLAENWKGFVGGVGVGEVGKDFNKILVV